MLFVICVSFFETLRVSLLDFVITFPKFLFAIALCQARTISSFCTKKNKVPVPPLQKYTGEGGCLAFMQVYMYGFLRLFCIPTVVCCEFAAAKHPEDPPHDARVMVGPNSKFALDRSSSFHCR